MRSEPREETYGLSDNQIKNIKMAGSMEGRAAARRTARYYLKDEAAIEDLVNRYGGAQ